VTITLEVQVRRGDILESRHRIEAAVVDVEGRIHASTAEPQLVTSFRSAAKPFQLLALVERGHADRFHFSDEEVAVMAASHTGSAYHRALVTGILDRIELGPEHLACGYHDPIDPEALAEVRAHPERCSPLHNNCSGKHAGMLALARAEGWPVEGYERPDHGVQQLALRSVAEVCGLAPEEILTGTDNCRVVVFGLPVTSMARGYARLAAAMATGDARDRALHRIRSAMTTYPQAVGGAKRFSTQLMEAGRGRFVSKGGAEGLECIGLPGQGIGVTLKVRDGSGRALAPAVVALLEHLGMLSEAESERLAAQREPVLKNPMGQDVGRLTATLEALSPTG
jgi:L-asparaginase II